jgi:hypothetical protein
VAVGPGLTLFRPARLGHTPTVHETKVWPFWPNYDDQLAKFGREIDWLFRAENEANPIGSTDLKPPIALLRLENQIV